MLVTEADVVWATLATADVTSSGAPGDTPPVVDAEQADPLQLVDALKQQYSDVFQEASSPPPYRESNMSFLFCLILNLHFSGCTGWLLLSYKRFSGRSLSCLPRS